MKFKMLIVLLVVLIGLLVGCAGVLVGKDAGLGRYRYTQQELNQGQPVKVIPIWIDKNFGEADKLAIDDAITAWNYSLNGYIRLKVVDTAFDMEVPKIVEQVKSDGWLFMKIKSDNPMVPKNDKGYWTIGFCERIGGNHLYLVRDRLGNDDIFGVTLHEIGHLMGSGHVGEKLMFPHYTRARFQCIDYETMKTVASYRHLPADRLNYCVDKEAGEMSGKPAEVAPDGGPTLSNCPND